MTVLSLRIVIGFLRYALVDGFPVWANFLLALMEDCDKAYQRERTLSNPRLEKYLKKYRRTL